MKNQGLVLSYCALLALRFEDLREPVKKVQDHEIHGEKELFAG